MSWLQEILQALQKIIKKIQMMSDGGGISTIVAIDIKNLQNSLGTNIRRHWTPHRTIGKIRIKSSTYTNQLPDASELYKEDFSPVAVSIRPYHHGEHRLESMEKKKWDCLHFILTANRDKTLGDYLRALWELYPVALSYYAEEIKMESSRFVEMLLLDTCFIIVTKCGLYQHFVSPNSILEEANSYMDLLDLCLTKHDLLLMENQIPFAVIKRIFELFTGEENMNSTFLARISVSVEEILSNNPVAIDANNKPRDICHLLHLCHMYFRPTRNRIPHAMRLSYSYSCSTPNRWHPAVRYHVSGVKLEKREFNKRYPHSLLDVRFGDGVLQIRYFFIDEGTAIMFRNLIALEQINSQFGNDIMAYITFMSQLESDVKDVSLLVSTGIIAHQFASNDEVLNILSRVSANIDFRFDGDYYLKSIHQGLEGYYENSMKFSGGWFRHLIATRGWF